MAKKLLMFALLIVVTFSTVFADAFFSNSATFENLSTKTIYLRYGGNIQSDNSQYVPGKLGLNIDYVGNIDANGYTHIGGNCTIDGNANIKTDGTISGTLDIEGSAFLHGRTIIEGDATFSGDIYSGPLELTSSSPQPKVYNYPAGAYNFPGDLRNVTGMYGNIQFDRLWVGFSGGQNVYLALWSNGVKVYEHTKRIYYAEERAWYRLDYQLTYSYNGTSGSKTFKLKNLPSTEPSEPNIVWNDNGVLKITS